MSTQQEIYSIPWTPTLKGTVLPGCKLVTESDVGAKLPSRFQEDQKAFAPLTYQSLLANVPFAEPVIRESVTAIWRLSLLQSEGADDASWQDHLEAWLVSGHHDVAMSWLTDRDG
jgi:hypothetical protein